MMVVLTSFNQSFTGELADNVRILVVEDEPDLRHALVQSLAEAGFGETTRAAMALDEEEPGKPGPMMLQLELRTVPAD